MNGVSQIDDPVELIAEFNDSAGGPNQPALLPGEGLVECVIIHEFSDSADDADMPLPNGAAEPTQQLQQTTAANVK
jgi:hypothetical protein